MVEVKFLVVLAVIGVALINGARSSLPFPDICEGTADKGQVEWLRVDYCEEDEDFCERNSGVGVDYTVLYTPGVSTNGFSVSAVARKNKTEAPTPISYSYHAGPIERNVPVAVRQSLVLPGTGDAENATEMYVEWIIESDDGAIELCREYVFHVKDRNGSLPLPGNFTGDNCTMEGTVCNFAHSVCNTALTCECISSAFEKDGKCSIKPGRWCSTEGDCGGNGECIEVGNGIKACECKTDAFEYLGRCEVNSGVEVGAACTKFPYPCSIDRLVCGEDLRCACDAASTWDAVGKVCRRKIGYPCTAESQCGANAECASGDDERVCNCKLGYAPRLGQCEPLNQGTTIGETCLEPNSPCNFTNSICALVSATAPLNTCICRPECVFQEGCKLKVGSGNCKADAECVSGAGCIFKNDFSSSCECRSGTVAMEDGTCFQAQGGRVGDFCSVGDAPCAFPFSVCSESDKKCGCAGEAVDESEKCKIPYGSACSSSFDCVAFATCEDGVCRCESGTKELEGGKCKGCSIALYAPLLVLGILVVESLHLLS